MPGYGILGPGKGGGLLSWSWATERLERSHDYWVATVCPDGRPHVMPVWGIWRHDELWFSSSPGSRKARNLAADPRCVVTTDDALEPVVIDGTAARVTDVDAITEFAGALNEKYSTDTPVDFFVANACLRVRPDRAIGLTEANFTGSPTRWTFA
jgi:PPOX class probable F420-dependent enzyme